MSEVRDEKESRDACFENWATREGLQNDDECGSTLFNWILDAWNAGWQASALEPRADHRWVEIKGVDDLPQETGEYIVTRCIRRKTWHVTTLRFYSYWLQITEADKRESHLRREHWLPSKDGSQYVRAYMPLPAAFKAAEVEETKE